MLFIDSVFIYLYVYLYIKHIAMTYQIVLFSNATPIFNVPLNAHAQNYKKRQCTTILIRIILAYITYTGAPHRYIQIVSFFVCFE